MYPSKTKVCKMCTQTLPECRLYDRQKTTSSTTDGVRSNISGCANQLRSLYTFTFFDHSGQLHFLVTIIHRNRYYLGLRNPQNFLRNSTFQTGVNLESTFSVAVLIPEATFGLRDTLKYIIGKSAATEVHPMCN